MAITIHLFAGLADAIGASRIVLNLEPKADGEPFRTSTVKETIARLYPQAADLLAVSFVAVNQAYAAEDVIVAETDEIALIPPVSGGQDLAQPNASPELPQAEELYLLTNDAISVEDVTAKVLHPHHGAAITFTGTTREFTEGLRTVRLEYEAYAPMALATMKQIGEEIASRWPGTRCAITHRLGLVEIKEISVVIAVSAPHRATCYEASRYAIERLKQIVPIWKKEVWEDGSEWKGHQLGPWNPLAANKGTANSAQESPQPDDRTSENDERKANSAS
ncbi:molybdenum cofactor biosynthesis protein [Paenibacillus sp. MBLB4367]|uniref:molybdenum cofactor biosynthesis protein n=1 Tax=Paenibacillus sp. MBLB4367 TaxID=3384767 RepID=UPI00390827E5